MFDRLLRGLQARAFREAWRGRHSAWFVVGTALWMVNRARRGGDSVVYRTRLEPGESLIIETRAPRSGPPSER